MYASYAFVRSCAIRLCALLSPLLLAAGCGGKQKMKAEAPEANYDWSDYKGTYAPGGDGTKPGYKAEKKKPEKKPEKVAEKAPHKAPDKSEKTADKADKTEKVADKAEKTEKSSEKTSPAAAAAKTSAGTILGRSVSSVTPEAVATATKAAMKSKIVSSNVLVGPEYEQIQVVLKGMAVQIVRPARAPDASGPKIRSPKARSDSLSKTESGWYDESANVLVLVQAPKKAASQKALKAILKH